MGYGNYADTMDTLEKALTPGPWVLGERFSAADVYLGSAIGWALSMKALEPRPAFGAYLEPSASGRRISAPWRRARRSRIRSSFLTGCC